MESLRIKCPSCGIVLDVRNSKNEAVKKITCPNCKKQLAVTFADPQEKPAASHPAPIGALYEGDVRHQLHEGMNPIPHVASGLLELRVVKLATGGAKHILRALTNEQQALVNGKPLQQDDEIVLLRGDELQVGHVLLTFDKPGRTLPKPKDPEPTPVPIPEPKPTPDPDPQPEKPRHQKIWLLVAAIVLAGLALWYFIPSKKTEPQLKIQTDSIVIPHDTARQNPAISPKQSAKPKNTPEKEAKPKQDSNTSSSSTQDDFSLEVEAAKGSVKAQYQLGMRWVTSNDCSEVVKGVKYLEAAARSGNTNAQYALGIVYQKGSPACGISRNPALARQYMQQAAQKGHEKAIRFLESNNNE